MLSSAILLRAMRVLALCLLTRPAASLVHNFTNFTRVASYNSLAGRTLRVAFLPYLDEVWGCEPGQSCSPEDPTCCSTGESCTGCEWHGHVIDAYSEIQLKTGFSIEEVVVSDESKAASPTSIWSACAKDVGLGHVDLCLSTFWILSSRLELSHFALWNGRTDVIALVVPFNKARETGGRGKTFFWFLEPLNTSAWVWFIALGLMTAFVLFITEGGLENIFTEVETEYGKKYCCSPPGCCSPEWFVTAEHKTINTEAVVRLRDSLHDQIGKTDLGENVLGTGLLSMMTKGEFIVDEPRIPSTEACGWATPPCGLAGFSGLRIKRLARVLYVVLLGLFSSGKALHSEDHKPRSFGGKLMVLVVTVMSVVFVSRNLSCLAEALARSPHPAPLPLTRVASRALARADGAVHGSAHNNARRGRAVLVQSLEHRHARSGREPLHAGWYQGYDDEAVPPELHHAQGDGRLNVQRSKGRDGAVGRLRCARRLAPREHVPRAALLRARYFEREHFHVTAGTTRGARARADLQLLARADERGRLDARWRCPRRVQYVHRRWIRGSTSENWLQGNLAAPRDLRGRVGVGAHRVLAPPTAQRRDDDEARVLEDHPRARGQGLSDQAKGSWVVFKY